MQKDTKLQKRTKCLVFSRVVGYLTPVQNWNEAKKAEFEQREFYTNDCSCHE
jgi:anaerobic ribonucleoside-triphosphate reductase